jgi:outer membrane scaffolding protein for murein synthesis (MipA/OmpV family)
MHFKRWFAVLVACCGSRAAEADLRERLQEVDLNAFAVGGGVAFNESVYAGASASTTYYPVFADLFPSAFNDRLLFSRDGGYGLRWARKPGWEIGGLVRLQTLGFAAGDSEELRGMPDRPWTIELGPTIGWRGTAIDVDWTTFVDAFRHQTGASHLLRLSWPRRGERGYIVPELGLRRQTKSFVDYYYGVPAAAATAERPAYEGVAAYGWSAAIDWGVRVREAWLVTGRLGVEKLGDGITSSPIVGDDERAFFSIRLSYDRPLFKPPVEPRPESREEHPRAELLALLADVATDTWLAGREAGDADGTGSGGGDELGYLGLSLRFTARHSLELAIFDALHDSQPQQQAAAAQVRDSSAGYAFTLHDDPQKRVAVGTGLNLSTVSVDFADPGAADLSLRSTAPLPYVAIAGDARFKRKLAAHAQVKWSLQNYDGYSGSRLWFAAGISHRTFPRVALGVGYVFNRLSLAADDGRISGRLDFDYEGPTLILTGFF